MTIMKKQLKLKKFLQRNKSGAVDEDCDDLREEIEVLQRKLAEAHDELFQLQRNTYRHEVTSKNNKPQAQKFVRHERIVLNNSIDSLRSDLELMSMLTGIEVQSYQVGEHCAVVYHMEHDTEHELKHGLYIDMKNGANQITKSSLPYGFNLKGVLDNYDNVMLPECLRAVRRGLVAYYKRQQQFDALKKLLNIEAQLVKNTDASHIEVSFMTCNHRDQDDDQQFPVTLMLDYRIYDIMPKQYAFVDIDLPPGLSELLKEQCDVFKRKPLEKAFKEAFIDGVGPYLLTKQFGVQAEGQFRGAHRKRSRPNQQHYNNDDTFHPEDCSGTDEEMEE